MLIREVCVIQSLASVISPRISPVARTAFDAGMTPVPTSMKQTRDWDGDPREASPRAQRPFVQVGRCGPFLWGDTALHQRGRWGAEDDGTGLDDIYFIVTSSVNGSLRVLFIHFSLKTHDTQLIFLRSRSVLRMCLHHLVGEQRT